MHITARTSYVVFFNNAFFSRNFVELRWCRGLVSKSPFSDPLVRSLSVGLRFMGFVSRFFFLSKNFAVRLRSVFGLGLEDEKKLKREGFILGLNLQFGYNLQFLPPAK